MLLRCPCGARQHFGLWSNQERADRGALPAAERFDFPRQNCCWIPCLPDATAMQAWKIANPKEKRKNQAVSLQRARQWALPSMSGRLTLRGAADRYFRWHGAHAFSVTPESPLLRLPANQQH